MSREPTALNSVDEDSRERTGEHSMAQPRSVDLLLSMLLAIDLLLFAGGATAHLHVPIPLGFVTWVEPLVLPASIIEGVGAVSLVGAFAAIVSRATLANRLTWWVLWYCFAGVLWGLARLALGSIPEANTVTNDFLHIAMILVTTLALVRLAGTAPDTDKRGN